MRLKSVFFFLFCLFFVSACSVADQVPASSTAQPASIYPTPEWDSLPEVLPQAAKGYELYSWQSGSDWLFTLITATNRNKTFEELTAPGNEIQDEDRIKITVASEEDLVNLLSRLPQKTEVFWSGIDLSGEVEEGTFYFSFPPDDLVDRVQARAEELGILLHTLK